MTATEAAAKEWFHKAKQDLVSYNMLRQEAFTGENALFHAQQAIEKWFKGLGFLANINMPKTHDLIALISLIHPIYPEFKDTRWHELASRISMYSVDSRYPGMSVDEEEIAKDILVANEALEKLDQYITKHFSNLY